MAAVVMRPIGAAVHLRAGTVNLKIVRWMVFGSVPAAFWGAYLLHLMGNSDSAENNIEVFLGIALLVGASAMVLRFILDRRGGKARTAFVSDVQPRSVLTLALGIVGGLIVGITSVGSGSLILGSVPAVLVGSLLSSTVPDRYIRPAIAFAIFASGLKYVGIATTALGWILCATLLGAGVFWLVYARPWKASAAEARPPAEPERPRPGEPDGTGEPRRALVHD